jgi:hypothetical protein
VTLESWPLFHGPFKKRERFFVLVCDEVSDPTTPQTDRIPFVRDDSVGRIHVMLERQIDDDAKGRGGFLDYA